MLFSDYTSHYYVLFRYTRYVSIPKLHSQCNLRYFSFMHYTAAQNKKYIFVAQRKKTNLTFIYSTNTIILNLFSTTKNNNYYNLKTALFVKIFFMNHTKCLILLCMKQYLNYVFHGFIISTFHTLFSLNSINYHIHYYNDSTKEKHIQVWRLDFCKPTKSRLKGFFLFAL